jgi:fibronectin-binding autotransporter adhesin
LLEVAGRLRVGTTGAASSATVNLTDGGEIRSAGGVIGYGFGPSLGPKSVTVSGAGSRWTMTDALNMTRGSLTVLDGGAVSTTNSQIAGSTVPATILVAGADSTYSVSGDQGVTSATITLSEGGQMNVGSQFRFADTAGGISVLNIGGEEAQPAAAAGVLNAATLAFGPGTGRLNFNHTEADYAFATAMSGAGAINQVAGVTRLTADSSGFTGATTVFGGTLLVDRTLGNATSTVGVATGGTLGGTGTIGGGVTVANGAISPGDLGITPETLTINGNLALSNASALNYNFGQAGVVGGMLNDHLAVGDDLTLNGTINVTQSAGGTFGPGVYRIISYNGALTDNGLAVGTMPTGSSVTVQSSIANQVNLVNTAGLTLNFWDGEAGPKNNNAINGGDGTWRANSDDNWSDENGVANGAFALDGFAVFQGAPGTVTVDTTNGAVRASGMQFAVDGYTVQGGPITLVGPQSIIRVGVGSVGADYVATIASDLNGATQLVKDDLGTLVLSGTNSYIGGTLIRSGTLSISSDANLGDVAGGLTFDGGTLETTADVTTSRAVTLAGVGIFQVDSLTTTTLNGSVTGPGTLTKAGDGTLVLASTGNSSGGTNVGAGLLQVDGNLTTPSLAMTGTSALIVNGTVEATGAAPVALTGDGGAATITVGTGGTLRANGDLGDGNDAVTLVGTLDTAGARLGLGGGNDGLTLNDGATINSAGVDGGAGTDALVANNAAATVLNGASVTGFESLTKQNTGVLRLVGDHSYSSGTTIAAGTLQLGDGSTAASLTGDVVNNGTLAFNLPGSYSFAGLISGTGSVDQIGPGTTTLTANNSYTGPTNVQAGTLLVNGNQSAATGLTAVSGGGTLGGTGIIGGGVTVADGAINPGAPNAVGTLAINGGLTLGAGSALNYEFGQANVPGGTLNDLLTVGGDLTLDGTLNVSQAAGGIFGPGLYRIISYGGTLTDHGLTLGTMPSGAQASVQTAIANQVNLINSGGLPLSYWDGDLGPKNDGVISGGNGTWRAANDSNWTNETGVNNAPYSNGSFAIFAGAPGRVTVDNGQGAVSAAGMQFATNGYTIQGDAIRLVPSTGSQATIRVGDGTAAGAGYTATIAAPLTGTAGLAKTDLGTLALTGTSSYTGATDVIGGALAVNGSIAASAVMVHSGGRLTGTGTVGSTTVASGGTIAPGNSIGTLHVAGNYSQKAGATYQLEVDPTSSASDRIAVARSADLQNGAVINVTKTTNAPYVLGTRYTVLTTTGGLSGTFDVTGNTALTAFAGLTDVYDANNAYLLVGQVRPFTAAGATPNQISVATGLAGLSPTNPLMTALFNLPDDQAARQAFDQLSGESHASAKAVIVDESRFVRDAAIGRLREAFCTVGANATAQQQLGVSSGPHEMPAADGCTSNADRLTIWGQAFGSWGHTDGNGNAASLSRSTTGFVLGVDAPVSDSWRVGVLGGYSSSDFDVSRRVSSGSSDNYHVGVYAGTQWGGFAVRAGAAYTWHDITTNRSVSFAGFSDSLQADYNAGTAQVFGDLGYRIDLGAMAFEPFASLAHVSLHTDGFTESGAGAALTGRSQDMTSTFTTLGLRASTALAFGDVNVIARGSLGWRHAFGDVTPLSALSFSGGSPFDIAGVPIAKDAAVADIGLDFQLSESAVLGISYGGQFSADAIDQSVRGSFNLRF